MADILVVEDEPDIGELIQQFLEGEGHTVRRAANGKEALIMQSQRLPEVVLMDIQMPELSGTEMAERMFVENAGRECIPIVVTSASTELVRTARAIGTPYALPKPFYPEALLAVVDRALRERRIPKPAW
ncbi:MAG: response regulator [Deltaproteobacteria bacterium]|nr:response regulator [Deltaproteobacteria bacterium]